MQERDSNGRVVHTNEYSDSQNIVYLLKSKAELVDEIKCIDINQEIVEAKWFLDQQKNSGNVQNQ